MRKVLFAPHNDDEALFASYSILKHRLHVIVCLYENEERTRESLKAMRSLGTTLEQWQIKARNPKRWNMIEERMRLIKSDYEHVFAPRPEFEANGHSVDDPSSAAFGILDHDWVGELALRVWGPERTTFYQTYRRWEGRMREGREVVPETGWTARKLRALSYYKTQHDLPSTVSWFTQPDLREWIV